MKGNSVCERRISHHEEPERVVHLRILCRGILQEKTLENDADLVRGNGDLHLDATESARNVKVAHALVVEVLRRRHETGAFTEFEILKKNYKKRQTHPKRHK